MGTPETNAIKPTRPLIDNSVANLHAIAKPKTYSAEEIEDAFIKWYDTPVPDRTEKNVSELSERTGMPVEAFGVLQRQTYGAWLMTPEEQRMPALKQDIAILLGVVPQRLANWMRDANFASGDMRAAFRAKLLNHAAAVAENLQRQATSPLGGAPEIKLYTQLAGLSDAKAGVEVNVQQNATVYQGRPMAPEAAERIPEVRDEIIDVEPE